MLESKHLIRKDFESFVRKAFSECHDGKKLGREKYIQLLCHELNRVADGDEKRLVINLPPRHLKTFLGAVCLPAWILAHAPASKIMVITYGDQLAELITYEIRRILVSAWFKKLFTTRIAPDRTKVGDFATTKGGGVFATSVDGQLAGRGADLIIFDDPIDLKDAGNIKRIEHVNRRFDSAILSRLNNPKEGRVVIIAHRLNDKDLSAHIKEQGGWRRIVLPLIATRARDYKIGSDTWHRRSGTLLRPGSHTPKELSRLQKTAINPDFELFYQQGRGSGQRIAIKPTHFARFYPSPAPQQPVILSVDPGQGDGPQNSYSVIQAWMPVEGHHDLLEQWREQCDYFDLKKAYYRFVRRFRPAVCLIEATASGPALMSDVSRKLARRIEEITPDGRSKAARLIPHVPLIRAGGVRLPEGGVWCPEFIQEFVEFPVGPSDDQIDAATQYLDWISVNPIPEPQPADGIAQGTSSSGRPLTPASGWTTSTSFGVVRRSGR
jgi:predicted phage terminase large subunit-like protein